MGKIVAITGGIGSGKSIVSNILRAMGYTVYDSDTNAKLLMNNSKQIKYEIARKISSDAIVDDNIDRKVLSDIVFSDDTKLKALNAIVHHHVLADILDKRENHDLLFVETAILYQSKMDQIVNEVWEVTAPEELRIMRVMKRNGFNRKQVIERIKSQSFTPEKTHPNMRYIVNDGNTAILPQVLTYLAKL